jgi:hypothetical protein
MSRNCHFPSVLLTCTIQLLSVLEYAVDDVGSTRNKITSHRVHKLHIQ